MHISINERQFDTCGDEQANAKAVSHLIWHLESNSQAVELICNVIAADGQVGFSHFLVAIAMLDLERWACSIPRS